MPIHPLGRVFLWGLLVAAGLQLIDASAAAAQGPERARVPPGCVMAGRGPDSVTHRLWLTVATDRGGGFPHHSAERERAMRMLTLAGAALEVPSTFALPAVAGTPVVRVLSDAGRWHAVPEIASEMSLAFGADGRLARVEVARPSVSGALDSLLVDALVAVEERGDFARRLVAPIFGDEPFTVRLHLALSRADSTLPFVQAGELRAPLYEWRTSMITGRPNPPAYPRELRERRIQGTVVLAFDVDADGRPLLGTARPVGAAHPEFLAAVRAVLPTYQYLPASVGGCPIRSTVEQRFDFRPGR